MPLSHDRVEDSDDGGTITCNKMYFAQFHERKNGISVSKHALTTQNIESTEIGAKKNVMTM